MSRLNYNPPDFDYDVMPVGQSHAWALKALDSFYSTKTAGLPVVVEGECEDRCGRKGARVRYGRFSVCRRCAWCRRRVAEKVMNS